MTSDDEIQKDVEEKLEWDPFLAGTQIEVTVKEGVVTLAGNLDSYSKKIFAERAAKKALNIKTVIDNMQVGIPPGSQKTDADIAKAVLNILKLYTLVDEEKIKIQVEDGHVTLQGEIIWEYQPKKIQSAIESLKGVRSVVNLITVKQTFNSFDAQQIISPAFQEVANDVIKITIQNIDKSYPNINLSEKMEDDTSCECNQCRKRAKNRLRNRFLI